MSSLVARQSAFLQNVCKLVKFATDLGYQVTFGEAWRTREQAAIYAKRKQGIADSLHCDRLAVDLNFYRGGQLVIGKNNLESIGLFWESLGGVWGGRFTKYDDSNHFQARG